MKHLLLIFLLFLLCDLAFVVLGLPVLNVGGFSWAENLAFDGLGRMFVSEAVRGEMWRIELCANETSYCSELHISDAAKIKQFGGLAFSEEGTTIYAGVSMTDGTYSIVTAPTSPHHERDQTTQYEVFASSLPAQPNGMTIDWNAKYLYFTDEGTGKNQSGALYAVNIDTKETSIVSQIDWADGLYLDTEAKLLYVGELISMKIHVFDVSKGLAVDSLSTTYLGMNELGPILHMMDDLTVDIRSESSRASMADTVMLAADWTGRAVRSFSLDGTQMAVLAPPEGITFHEPTSVRWGKGPGFDPKSAYVSEGGGATRFVTNRRIIQLQL